MKKKIFTFIMVLLLVTATVSPVAASSNKDKASNNKAKSHKEETINQSDVKTKKQIKEQNLENEISEDTDLENEISEDTDLENEIAEEPNQKNEMKKEAKQEFKKIREQLKKKNLNGYSEEELNTLHQNIEQIKEQYSDIRVLPFDNIISKKASFKFDTPPVIKDGRTLVPVRALTQAYGADVSWDAENKKVTVEKDGDIVELYLNQTQAYVNGEEVVLDVPAEIMQSRTVVPLRFILESLGYEVEYDDETDTIEIIEDDESDLEENEDTVRTDTAITTGD